MAPDNLKTKYMTRNDCYTAGRKISPKGIMVHSTATPGVMASSWFVRWNRSYKAGEIKRQVCVHAFVDDMEIWQYLPWNHRGWHAGGAANNTHISFEICEPGGFSYSSGSTMVGYDAKKNEVYFRATWNNALDLCVILCKEYGLTEKDIICHSEGYKNGIASNHSDVMHWFPKHGESMDTFRAAVKEVLNSVILNDGEIEVGDVVEIKTTASKYYPGGPTIPLWVKKTYHKVTQVEFNGDPVIMGAKRCVLLGKKVDKASRTETAGIMTWVDIDSLNLISSILKMPEEKKSTTKFYRVQVGAFSNRENAEGLLKELRDKGYSAIIKCD